MERRGCRLHLMFLSVLVVLSGRAFAAPDALRCTFKAAGNDVQITIAAIDLGRLSAQMIGALGTAALVVTVGQGALHFEETTAVGNKTLTTVQIENEQLSTAPAVHSRHLVYGGKLVTQQLRGECERLTSG